MLSSRRIAVSSLAVILMACGANKNADGLLGRPGAECGDAVVDADLGEQCDLGALNSDTSACTLACLQNVCGDGLLGPDDECDDGLANSDSEADTCRLDCTLPTCGDGVVDSNEECEVGDVLTNGLCTASCQVDCNAGFGNCDALAQNGCEVDLSSSPEHCNACAHDCGGGACTASICSPVQVAELPTFDATMNSSWPVMKHHAGYVYINTEWGLVRVATASRTLATPDIFSDIKPFAAAFTFIEDEVFYYTAQIGAGIVGLYSAPLGTGVPSIVADATIVLSLDSDATHVYLSWIGTGTTVHVGRVAIGGSSVEELGSFASGSPLSATATFVDADHVYLGFISGAPLWRVGKTTATFDSTPIGTQVEAWSVVADSGHLYWAAGNETAVYRMQRDPYACLPDPFCAVESFATTSGRPFGLAIDTTDVYWVELDSNVVARRPRAGGITQIVATGLAAPRSIAVDDDFIYWLDAPTDGSLASVWKLAK